jgi:hypothetical protein
MLTAFGTIAVATMFVSYWLERRSRWYVLTFAAASAATAIYSVLVEAYPITVVEALWAAVALNRFLARRRTELRGVVS